MKAARTGRLLRWSALLLVLAVLLGGAAALALARSGKPVRSGEARLPGLRAPVEVRWDAYGVPHLKGGSGRDLTMALGYLHANDRMAQLELGRRAAAGRLSELFGERTLAADIELRRLRLREAAQAVFDRSGAESRAWLEAYAAGVNAWLVERGGDLPPTLRLLGVRPDPWTPADSLGFVFLMARDLSFWQGRPEELRFEWLRDLGPERTVDLLGGPPLHLPAATLAAAAASRPGAATRTPVPDMAAALPMDQPEFPPRRSPRWQTPGAGDFATRPEESANPPHRGGTVSLREVFDDASHPPGSNGWAVAAGRSSEGTALVANDPHLPLRLPGTWYEAHFRAPDYEVMGATLPGVPGVVIGQNAELAWAFTNAMVDDHDLFLEEQAATGTRVRRGDTWAPIIQEEVSIHVRGRAPLRLVLHTSDRGPLLPADPRRGLPARSLAWTAYLADDPLAAFIHLGRTRRTADIPAGIGGFAAPAQNLIAADADGGLLHLVLGRLPQRRRGDGRLPAPGWDPSYGWDGLRPVEDNPRLAPVDGTLVSANQDFRWAPLPGKATPDVPGDYALPARARRIAELLATRPRWSAAELAHMQTDTVSLYAREVVARSAGDHTGDAALAWRHLSAWDGDMALAGTAALFDLYEYRLMRAIFSDELDLARASAVSRRHWLLRVLRGEMAEDWFDDVRTGGPERREDIIARTLAEAWRDGVQRWGAAVERWPRGAYHALVLRHPLGELPVVGRLLNRGPFPVAGSATSIAAFPGTPPAQGLAVDKGPSLRRVAVVGDGDRSLAALPGGQSGHPFDRHYDDQIAAFLDGRMRPLAWSEAAIGRATVSVLRLQP